MLGENPEMYGGAGNRVNEPAEVTVPPAVVIVNGPVPLPKATAQVAEVDETLAKLLQAVPLTAKAVIPDKFVPVTVTVAPGPAELGVKLAIVGAGGSTVKLDPEVAVPPAVVK